MCRPQIFSSRKGKSATISLLQKQMMMIKEATRLPSYEDYGALQEAELSLQTALNVSNFPCVLQHLRSLLRLLRARPNTPEAAWVRLTDLFRRAVEQAKTQPDSPSALKETCLLVDLFPAAVSAVVASEAYGALGCALIHTQDFEMAAKSLHKAVSAAMSLSDTLINRATHYYHLCEAYFHQGKHKQAVRYGSQAAIYAEQMPESVFSESARQDLRSVYSLLAKSEEALKRYDRARNWLKRSLFFFAARSEALPQSPDLRRKIAVKEEHSHSVPVSAAQSPRVSINSTIKREQVDVQEISCLPDVTQKEGCRMWTRNSMRYGSVDDLKPLLRVKDRKKPATPNPRDTPEAFDCPKSETEWMNTLGRPPRPTFPDPPTTSTLLYQCWKKLKSGAFAHIRVSEAPPNTWIVDLKCSDGSRLVEERFGPQHAWRRFQPQVLASLLQLGPKGEFVLNGDISRAVPNIELLREKRDFDGITYQVVYRTDSNLQGVEIKAEGGGKQLRKTVVNDIELASQQDTVAYVREVLSPQLHISEGHITVTPTQAASRLKLAPLSEWKPHQSSLPKRTGRSQDRLQPSKSESPSCGRLSLPKDLDVEEKVYYIPDDTSFNPNKDPDSKIVIRISETHAGTVEYQRNYQHLKIPRRSSVNHLAPPPELDVSPKLDKNSLLGRLRRAKEAPGSPCHQAQNR